MNEARRSDFARLLLEYAQELYSSRTPGLVPQYTANEDCNRFIVENPNALLFGVLFDQGIPAHRAWSAPYELRERLGHFDLQRIEEMDPAELAQKLSDPPALHRYVVKMPRWIQSAAARLNREYDGDAAQIWAGNPRTTDVSMRLQRFDGIGPKKSEMTVNLLKRDLNIPMQWPEGTNVAYDIHIRRVFLRAGVVEEDSLEAITSAAIGMNRGDPGALDLPAWFVGRSFCRPSEPNCEECPVSAGCAKLIGRGDHVS